MDTDNKSKIICEKLSWGEYATWKLINGLSYITLAPLFSFYTVKPREAVIITVFGKVVKVNKE